MFQLNDVVRIDIPKPLPGYKGEHQYHNMVGQIIRVINEKLPFPYLVKLDGYADGARWFSKKELVLANTVGDSGTQEASV